MKSSTIAVRLDAKTNKNLESLARSSGKNKSEIAREAIKRQISLMKFDKLRRKTMPFAEARGYLTDEDVFNEIS